MILGQLRMGARQTNYAPLCVGLKFWNGKQLAWEERGRQKVMLHIKLKLGLKQNCMKLHLNSGLLMMIFSLSGSKKTNDDFSDTEMVRVTSWGKKG